MKLGKATNHEILIKPTSNQGFIIEIGPKQFCFEGRQNMIRALNKYLQDPIQLEKDLREKEGVISREYILGLGLGEREDEESEKFQETQHQVKGPDPEEMRQHIRNNFSFHPWNPSNE